MSIDEPWRDNALGSVDDSIGLETMVTTAIDALNDTVDDPNHPPKPRRTSPVNDPGVLN
jgi:hypothetical protein